MILPEFFIKAVDDINNLSRSFFVIWFKRVKPLTVVGKSDGNGGNTLNSGVKLRKLI